MRSSLFIFVICTVVFNSCHINSKDKVVINIKPIDDFLYVVDSKYENGDVRRYGIKPQTPFSNKTWEKIIQLADEGMPLTFKNGIYYGNLVFKGVDSIKVFFDNATIAGSIQIINNKENPSKNISLQGEVTVLDKVFIRNSQKIDFNILNIISDTINNIYKEKNRGLSIYAGTKDLKIKTLKIQDFGGDESDFYKYSAAAMQVHGYKNNPENIEIKNIKIINAARNALYLTGNNHKIDKIEIENFGFGSNKNMFGIEDAKPSAQKIFSGAWFNKCNDCIIDTLSIKALPNNKTYSARFDLGIYSKPCIINNIEFLNYAKQMPIEDDVLTNVLVKNVLEDN